MTTCYDVFAECVNAIDNNELIQAVSDKDKEFHFQNWLQARIEALGLDYDEPARNTYPDFRLVQHPEGYEIKGLAVPRRDKNYDSNSQIPTGIHHGRTIFYVFGRYPKVRAAKEYPVIDLGCVCKVMLAYAYASRELNRATMETVAAVAAAAKKSNGTPGARPSADYQWHSVDSTYRRTVA